MGIFRKNRRLREQNSSGGPTPGPGGGTSGPQGGSGGGQPNPFQQQNVRDMTGEEKDKVLTSLAKEDSWCLGETRIDGLIEGDEEWVRTARASGFSAQAILKDRTPEIKQALQKCGESAAEFVVSAFKDNIKADLEARLEGIRQDDDKRLEGCNPNENPNGCRCTFLDQQEAIRWIRNQTNQKIDNEIAKLCEGNRTKPEVTVEDAVWQRIKEQASLKVSQVADGLARELEREYSETVLPKLQEELRGSTVTREEINSAVDCAVVTAFNNASEVVSGDVLPDCQ